MNNELRIRNFNTFIENLSPELYHTDYRINGSVNYALVLILKEPDEVLFNRVLEMLDYEGIEYSYIFV